MMLSCNSTESTFGQAAILIGSQRDSFAAVAHCLADPSFRGATVSKTKHCVDCNCLVTWYARRCRSCFEATHHHGHAKRGAKDPEYEAWNQMKGKCYRASHPSFKNYGGRGIRMADEWRYDFMAFYSHIGPRPTSEHTVERINNDGNYEPGNVKWATHSEQNRNQRSNVNLTIDGVTMCVADWAILTKRPASTIYRRVDKGWDDHSAVFGRAKDDLSALDIKVVRRLYEEECLSHYRICLALGIDPRHQAAVRRLLLAHDVPTRSRSDACRLGRAPREQHKLQESA
jgi:hypothetical protein